MAKGSRALTAYAVVFAGFSAEERRKANGWLTSMNCRVTAGVTNNTTHVIASQPAWNKGHKILEAAFTENEGRAKSGDKDKTPIKIVSLTWAEDCSTNRSKKAEGPYLCERIWRKDKDGGSKAASSAGGAVKEVKTVPAMLLQETGVHVDWREEERTRRMEDEIENRKTLEKKARLQEDREEHARLHAKGAKKARNEIFTGTSYPKLNDWQSSMLTVCYTRESPPLHRLHGLQIRRHDHQSRHPPQPQRAVQPHRTCPTLPRHFRSSIPSSI